jgi:hypothetical protein
LYTPPVTPREFVIPEVGDVTFLERAAEGGADDWGEVVTRYPYRKVGMDHLLSMELFGAITRIVWQVAPSLFGFQGIDARAYSSVG